jgi:hypothetical protein
VTEENLAQSGGLGSFKSFWEGSVGILFHSHFSREVSPTFPVIGIDSTNAAVPHSEILEALAYSRHRKGRIVRSIAPHYDVMLDVNKP